MASEEQTQEVTHGVRVDDHLEFIEWFEENPDEGQLEFRARGVAEEVTNQTTATIGEWSLAGEEMGAEREHMLKFDLPVELEEAMGFTDPRDRYEAIEGALAGLTACINGTIVFNAIREGIDVDEVTTRVRIPTDLRVLFGIHDVDKADGLFDEPLINVEVAGDGLSEEDKAKIKGYPKRSPVYNLVTLAHPNTPTVTVTSS